MRNIGKYAVVAATVGMLWPSASEARVTLGSYIGAVQQSLGRDGHVWAVGVTSGGSVSFNLDERWRLRFGLGWSRLWDDTTSTSLVKFANRTTETTRAWTTTSLRVQSEYRPSVLDHLGSYLSFGVGTASWDVRTYPGYGSIDVTQSDGSNTDFAATELLMIGGFGLEPALAANVHARFGVQADYYTGLGASFPDDFRDDRSHFIVGLTFGLSYSFGSLPGGPHRLSEPPLIIRPQERTHAGTTRGVESEVAEPTQVQSAPIPQPATAADLYHGPTTGELFASLVPQSRRLPDHLNSLQVQELVKPPAISDTDGDGIIDDFDRCPATPKGFSVDASGCMKLTAQAEGFVLRVNYPSGTTEPDSVSLLVLEDLAVRLNEASGTMVLIKGHTDNIGTDLDNLLISQRRATKVKDYLVSLGISGNRINAVGRGEAEPIASNGTASGRKANRRIEISYSTSIPDDVSTD